MSDLFVDEAAATNAAEFTVSEISGALKRTVEDAFGHVRVRGEISGYRGAHASGHAYFSLKDDKARIEAVIWRGVMGKLKFQPEEGMEVIATGKLTTYPGSSKYQIVIENLEPAGAGALMALLEERKKRLAQEGLFEEANKQLLPFMPKVIGVVTSPTGAVIRDIIHRISDRFPLHIIMWPVRVQGESCGAEVAQAVIGFNAMVDNGPIAKPDIIIVARGGGSLEDLWGFNDEAVVRAVAGSFIPVISAVGHETDWTLIDYAADRRAPTPTGAAEMAVPVKVDLQAQLASLHARLRAGLTRFFDFRRQRMISAARALPTSDQLLALPRRRFDEASSRLMRALVVNSDKKRQSFMSLQRSLSPRLVVNLMDRGRQKTSHLSSRFEQSFIASSEKKRTKLNGFVRNLLPHLVETVVKRSKDSSIYLSERAQRAYLNSLERYRHKIEATERLLKSLSYETVLERGFALVLDDAGQPIKRAELVPQDAGLKLRFVDGEVAVTTGTGQGKAAKKNKPTDGKLDTQGTLF